MRARSPRRGLTEALARTSATVSRSSSAKITLRNQWQHLDEVLEGNAVCSCATKRDPIVSMRSAASSIHLDFHNLGLRFPRLGQVDQEHSVSELGLTLSSAAS